MASHCCEGFCGQSPDSENVSVEQSVVEPKETTPDDMSLSSEGKLTNLRVFEERSTGPKSSMPTGQAQCFHTKVTRATCRNCPKARGDRIHHPQKFGDAKTADHKIVDEENESRLQHRLAVVLQDIPFGFNATLRRINLRRKL